MSQIYNVDISTGIVSSGGSEFPSTEGPQEVLNYNGTETIVFQMTGSVTPTFDFPVKFSRNGKRVIMQWDGFQKATTNTSNFLFTGDLVPARFLPTFPSGNPLVWEKTIIDGASPTSDFGNGSLSFGPLGNIQIGVGFFGGNFTNAYCGILGSSISYILT